MSQVINTLSVSTALLYHQSTLCLQLIQLTPPLPTLSCPPPRPQGHLVTSLHCTITPPPHKFLDPPSLPEVSPPPPHMTPARAASPGPAALSCTEAAAAEGGRLTSAERCPTQHPTMGGGVPPHHAHNHSAGFPLTVSASLLSLAWSRLSSQALRGCPREDCHFSSAPYRVY